jgi:hypothetical protein
VNTKHDFLTMIRWLSAVELRTILWRNKAKASETSEFY